MQTQIEALYIVMLIVKFITYANLRQSIFRWQYPRWIFSDLIICEQYIYKDEK